MYSFLCACDSSFIVTLFFFFSFLACFSQVCDIIRVGEILVSMRYLHLVYHCTITKLLTSILASLMTLCEYVNVSINTCLSLYTFLTYLRLTYWYNDESAELVYNPVFKLSSILTAYIIVYLLQLILWIILKSLNIYLSLFAHALKMWL